ncbi:MAG: DinB family protein [Bryobacteraceae bacterium]|nr:DinB family protein [Bryobacteraceae bacterium]
MRKGPPNPYAHYLEGKDAVKSLATSPKRLLKLMEAIPARAMKKPMAPGKWSPHQLLAHMADFELVMSARCRLIAFQDNPTLASYDQAPWLEGWKREKESLDETIVRFLALRNSQVALFRNLPESAWRRFGTHTTEGRLTIRDLMERTAGHDLHHVRQFAALASRGSGTKGGQV